MTSEYVDTGNWFVMDKLMKKKTLKSFFRTRPMVKPPKEYEPNDTNHYRVKARWAHGFAYAPYVVGSNSTKS